MASSNSDNLTFTSAFDVMVIVKSAFWCKDASTISAVAQEKSPVSALTAETGVGEWRCTLCLDFGIVDISCNLKCDLLY